MKTSDKKPGDRIQKLNSLVQQELGGIIIPYLENEQGLVTITKVDISRDLKWAKVWISIFGGNDDRILQVLHDNIYEIQGQINRILPMKVLPRLQFFLDTSSRYAARINEVIEEIHEQEGT